MKRLGRRNQKKNEMTIRTLVFKSSRPRILLLAFLLLVPASAMAQRFEISPYGGGFFPAKWADTTKLTSEGLYGVRAGIYFRSQFEIEGNAGYVSHFRFQDRDMGTRALVTDIDASYIFPGLTFSRFQPFATVGIGNVKVKTRGGQQKVLLLDPTFRNPDAEMSPVVLTTGTSFLSLNYGGGFKAFRLWGPAGVRTDFRLRTMPDFFGHANHWLEVTTGIVVAWGER
jgi:outer membrane protein with beta-barrel domain